MKKIKVLGLFILSCICCLGALAQSENQATSPCKRYRHIVFPNHEYIGENINEFDYFDYSFRPRFECRYLDDDLLLCRIDTILDTLNKDDHSFNLNLGLNKSIIILVLNVKIIEWYRSRENPMIEMFFSGEYFKDEFVKGESHGLKDYVSYIDSCENDTSEIFAKVFLLVKEDEISKINFFRENNCYILCSCSKKLDGHDFCSDMFFSPLEYDTKYLYNLKEWCRFLHDRIIEQRDCKQ